MAGAGVLAQPVVGLADIIRLVNRLPHLAGKAVLSGSPYFFIAHLHGLPAGGTVDNTVKEIVKGAGAALHDGWPTVNDLLHLRPFLRLDNRLMAALYDLPILTGDDVIGVGTDAFLVRPADQMCAFIKRVPQDMADPCAAPCIIIDVTFRIALYPRDGNPVLHQLLCDPHTAPAIQRKVIDFADHRRSLRVKDQMPVIVRVTHQAQGRRPAAVFPLSGTGHAPRQHFF